MVGEPRTDADIRRELSAERDQLVDALADLRGGIEAKRRLAVAVGTVVAAGFAAAATVKIVRRFRAE